MGEGGKGRSGNRACRMWVDHLMLLVLLGLVVTPFEWGLVHEWLGMAFFMLFAWHQWLNRAWWRSLFRGGGRGRWSAWRVVSTVVDVALAACVLALVASSVVLSRYVLAWVPAVPGASWARLVHLACSYWVFALANAHGGAHLKLNAEDRRQPVALAVGIALGIWGFVRLGLWEYMTLSTQFVMLDSATPFAVTVLLHALVAVGAMAVGCGVRALLVPRRGQDA